MSTVHTEAELLHPETRRLIERWLPEPERAIADAVTRAALMASRWGMTDLVPLPGGAMSVIARGHSRELFDWQVIVKAPLQPHLADMERDGLVRLNAVGVPVPMVLAFGQGVFVMRAVPGSPVPAADGAGLAEALKALHDPDNEMALHRAGLPRWQARSHQYFGEYASRIYQQAPKLTGWVDEARDELTGLLERAGKGLCHGDLQGKNVLRSPSGLFLIDPIACESNPAWDAALAAAQVAAAGGDATPVLAMADQLRMTDLAGWLRVAVVSVAGTTGFIDDQAALDRLAALRARAGRL